MEVTTTRDKRRYANDRENQKARVRKFQDHRREFIDWVKLGVGCADCGYKEYAEALDFDHISGQKLKGIGAMAFHALDKVQDEMMKCEVRCSNCHRIKTRKGLRAQRPFTRGFAVQVAVPAYGNVPAICQLSFGSFIGHGVAAGLIKHIGTVEGAYIDRARNDLVRQALVNGSTHICFIDQDMILPEGSLLRMLTHDVDIVGASYFGKDDFFTPVAFHLEPFRRIYELDECPRVISKASLPEGVLDCWCSEAVDHLHEIGGTGMGYTLIKTDLLRRMRDHFQDEMWFSSRETGEDIHLATRCATMGVPRYLDGFVQCGHVRTQIVTRQHYDWARRNAPMCKLPGCTRVAFWYYKDEDSAEKAVRCWVHRRPEAQAA